MSATLAEVGSDFFQANFIGNVLHMAEQSQRTLKEIFSEAKEAENADSIEDAIALYEEAVATDKLNEHAYNRLMMLFRNKKEYKKELEIIKKAINTFEEFYKSKIPKKSKMITSISNKLNRSFGFTDKKGNIIYSSGPIAK